MHGIGKIFETKYGGLIFSLISGCAYFIIVLDFVLRSVKTGGVMLGLFFSPAIIFGMALVILKSIKRLKDEESFGRINLIVYAHILLIVISLVFLANILYA